MKANKKRLMPIIEGVFLCGREEISVRGHRDSEKIVVDGNLKYINTIF